MDSVLGVSEETTRKLLKSVEGCVLVIDEAYGLFSGKSGGTYKTAANTMVQEFQIDRPGETSKSPATLSHPQHY